MEENDEEIEQEWEPDFLDEEYELFEEAVEEQLTAFEEFELLVRSGEFD